MKDKVAIVTGASSGIGLATAKELGKQGAKVVLVARSTEKLSKLQNEMQVAGYQSIAITADVSNEKDCQRLIEETVATYGKIDILINNAGISMRALFKDLTLDVLKQLMAVNFWGTVYCTKYALPHLLATKGSVVGVSSIAGFVGLPARTGYSASKYAMKGFLDTLRTENLKTGLHVMLIAPGFTASNIRNTALTADGSQQQETPRDEDKMMSAETVAKYLVKGIQKKKREIILTGEGKLTVFLNKFFPKQMDKIVYNHMAKEPDSPLK